MDQIEINKKAMENIYALEDSAAIFMEAAQDFNTEPDPMDDLGVVAPDDLMDVSVSPEPSYGNLPTNDDEMDPETQKFVVEEFARLCAQDAKKTISTADIPNYATRIMVDHGIMNAGSFLEKLMLGAEERNASQNVSEAQPNGAAAEDIMPANSAPSIDEPVGAEPLTAAPATPAPEPSLTANADDGGLVGDLDLGLGGAPEDSLVGDLNLGGEPAPEGDLGLEAAPAPEGDLAAPAEGESGEGDDLLAGLEDLDFGDENSEGGNAAGEGEGDVMDLGLGNAGGENDSEPAVSSDDEPAESKEPKDDVADTKDENDEDKPSKVEAQLESLCNDFAAKHREARVTAIVESFQKYRKARDNRAKMEANEKKVDAKLESILGRFDKPDGKSLDAKLESILSSVPAAKKKNSLHARLESILASVPEAKSPLTTRLEAILDSVPAGGETAGAEKPAEAADTVKESVPAEPEATVETPAAVEASAKVESLDEQLNAIIESVKK